MSFYPHLSFLSFSVITIKVIMIILITSSIRWVERWMTVGLGRDDGGRDGDDHDDNGVDDYHYIL